MDHSLRTISYIADIGDILVIMARRRLMGSPGDTDSMRRRKQAKIICHVFESEEVSVGLQALQTWATQDFPHSCSVIIHRKSPAIMSTVKPVLSDHSK